jgi:hypothetical protein
MAFLTRIWNSSKTTFSKFLWPRHIPDLHGPYEPGPESACGQKYQLKYDFISPGGRPFNGGLYADAYPQIRRPLGAAPKLPTVCKSTPRSVKYVFIKYCCFSSRGPFSLTGSLLCLRAYWCNLLFRSPWASGRYHAAPGVHAPPRVSAMHA